MVVKRAILTALILFLLLPLWPSAVANSVGWMWAEEPTVIQEEESAPALTDMGEWTVTAYCPCEKCCGEWALNRPEGRVYGASGEELQAGVSVAAPLPSGTVLEIEGLGTFTVHDKTAGWIVDKYQGRIVDIYFENHQEALQFGKRQARVWMVEGE